MSDTNLEQLAINTIRTLSIDAVQAAKSGHPGTPMALAPLVYTIWNRAMNFDPQDPIWPNRDRFVLSNGHASMLLWSVLHLTKTQAVDAEYESLGHPSVSLDDIRRFRQIDSRAPGHPEYHWVSGVETTTGPLGQGVATSVGMAIAQKWLANRYNKPDFEIFDYNIYAVTGDGCMMEGVASEAASLAGHLRLDNLCWIWDNNHITIEGDTNITFTEDVAARFLAYGWNVLRVSDANDIDRIEDALTVFRRTTGPPHVHRARQPYRLWIAQQAGHAGSTRRATRRRGNPPHQAGVWLARGGAVPRPRGRLWSFRCRHRSARRESAPGLDRALRGLPRQVPGSGDRDRSDAASRTAGQLGSKPAVVPGGREGSGRARGVGQGAQRACRRTSRGCSAVRRISAPPTRPH